MTSLEMVFSRVYFGASHLEVCTENAQSFNDSEISCIMKTVIHRPMKSSKVLSRCEPRRERQTENDISIKTREMLQQRGANRTRRDTGVAVDRSQIEKAYTTRNKRTPNAVNYFVRILVEKYI